MPAKLKTYKIDTGNSSVGPVGFVAYVAAESPEAALKKLRENVKQDGYEIENENDSDGEFKVIVYLNPANVLIEEVEENDDE